MKAMSLKIQITLLVILLIAGLVAAFSWTVVTNEKRMLLTEVIQKIILEGRNLALGSAKPLLHEDPAFELYPLVAGAQEAEKDIASIVVVDRAGIIKGHRDVLSVDRPYEPRPGLRAVPGSGLTKRGEAIRATDELIEVRIPIKDRGKTIGYVYIEYAKAGVLEAIAGINARMLRIGAIGLLVGAALSLLLALHITRPVSVLTRGVEAIGQGRLDTRIDVKSGKELQTLAHTFNGMAQRLDENRRALIEHERIARELEIAHEIQATLLPARLPHFPNIEMDAYYNAASEVGGDYFDLVPVDDDRLMIVVGDVAGKGVPGLIIMAMVRILVRALSRNPEKPAALMRQLNELLRRDMKSNMFVTLFWGILDTRTGSLDFANAGHMPLIVYRASRRAADAFRATAKPLGVFSDEIFCSGLEDHRITLNPGDCILQFTDGLNEMRNVAGEEYGIERLKEVLVAEAGGGALYIVNELRRSLDAFRGAAPQSDDLTIVVVKATPAGVARTRLERNKAADGVLSR
jgi:serine phosphatase RsbU (regulator of sigma subunit)